MSAFHIKRRLVLSWVAGLVVFAEILLVCRNYCARSKVHVRMRLDTPSPCAVQVYFKTFPRQEFKKQRSLSARAEETPEVLDAVIHVAELYGLRVDFGVAPTEFTILGGEVGDIALPTCENWSFSPNVIAQDIGDGAWKLKFFDDGADHHMQISFRRPIPLARAFKWKKFMSLLPFAIVVALATGMLVSIVAQLLEKADWVQLKLYRLKQPIVAGLSTYELVFLLVCAAYYRAWIFQPFDYSPDEAMRFEVTRFLFDHGRLPVNEEAINASWGFSYAHVPTMFCNVVGALFMKIGSFFTSNATSLLHAARMLGVLCVTGTVYCTMRISRFLFKPPFNWLAVCIVAFLPQFAYIGSYVNNDSAALFGSATILFAWVAAINGRWNYWLAMVLAIGIATCATAYYNSYPWILFSMMMFPLTFVVRNGRTGLVRMGLFIAGVSFLLAGYLFLRHLHLYGDLLGFETCRRFAMKFAAANYVPGVRKSPRDNGYSLAHMLFAMHWLVISAHSFIGFFGWMRFPVPSWCYDTFKATFCIGWLGALWKGAEWICNWRRIGICKWALLVSLIGCATAVIGLSIYYSYTNDFQAQGRYCFPALLPIALLTAKGIEHITSWIPAREIQGAIVFAFCLILGHVSWASYVFFTNLY